MLCDTCGAEGVILFDHDGESECARCLDERESREAEAAYERQCAAFYGGDGPVTVQDQYDRAAALKRRVG